MTLMTEKTAKDAMFGLLKSTLDTEAGPILGYVPHVEWQDVENATIPDLTKVWLHATITVAVTQQAGFNNAVNRRYETMGLLAVDIYAPRSEPNGSELGASIADTIRRAYEGSRTGGVWYRNVTSSRSGNTDNFAVYRVLMDFEYTEQGR